MYLFELVFSFSLDVYPAVKFLDYVVVVFLVSLRSLHTFSHSGCARLHSYQQCRNHQQWFLLLHILANMCVFWMIAILIRVRCYLAVVLICISLKTSHVDNLFMCLVAISVSLFEKKKNVYIYIYIQVFCWFSNWTIFWYIVVLAIYVCWILTLYWSFHLQIFSPIE